MQQDLERVARNRYGSWISSLLLILALAGFVALAIYFAPRYVAGLTGWQLVAFGLMMALVPALLWLIFFYLQDRLSPEPKGNVFGVFVLGGLLAAAIGQPVIERIFQVQDWMYTTWWVQLLASILVIGFVQEFLVYASCATRSTAARFRRARQRRDLRHRRRFGLCHRTQFPIRDAARRCGCRRGRDDGYDQRPGPGRFRRYHRLLPWPG